MQLVRLPLAHALKTPCEDDSVLHLLDGYRDHGAMPGRRAIEEEGVAGTLDERHWQYGFGRKLKRLNGPRKLTLISPQDGDRSGNLGVRAATAVCHQTYRG